MRACATSGAFILIFIRFLSLRPVSTRDSAAKTGSSETEMVV